MITLCFRPILRPMVGETGKYEHIGEFTPEFLDWCDDYPHVKMSVVVQDLDPGYQVDLAYDFEISGLTPGEEALWSLRWGSSGRKHPKVFPRASENERVPLTRPFGTQKFTLAVSM